MRNGMEHPKVKILKRSLCFITIVLKLLGRTLYVPICYASPYKLSATRLWKSHGNQIHASTTPLVTDLANFLSNAEVKPVTRDQKPMK
jgi:hypothetical protein